MPIEVDGVSLQHYAWNITTTGSRLRGAGVRGTNTAVAGLDGALWLPDKPLSELQFELSMWMLGCEPDGTMPPDGVGRARVRRRVDELLALMWRQDRLVEVTDTDTARRCFAEVLAPFDPTTTAGATRAEVVVECNVPAGCWEDTTVLDSGPVALASAADVTLEGFGGGTLPLGGIEVELTAPGRNVRIATTDGAWLQFNGDLPAASTVRINTDPRDPQVYDLANPDVSLMSQLRWSPGPAPLAIPFNPISDPVLHTTAEATGVDSRIRVRGRRRWRTA